jgi:16S rRNA (guanine527-N7)-methyltransferase
MHWGMTEFGERFNVSRETLLRINAFRELLILWNRRINLVSTSTIDDFWSRHAADSAQIVDIAGDNSKNIIDMGAGAGFPGLMIAALLAEKTNDYQVTLVEMQPKKCAFLREAARTLGVKVNVENKRIEELAAKQYDLVTARAFAPLIKLLSLSEPYAQLGARMLFLKGEDVQSEIDEASTKWKFCFKTIGSITHSKGCVIEIFDLARPAIL